MSDNPFADPAAVPMLLAAIAVPLVIIIGLIAVLYWEFVVQPRRERRRRQRP